MNNQNTQEASKTAGHTPGSPMPSEIIAMSNDELAWFCYEHNRIREKLAEWEERFEMGPAWVSASLTEQAHERKWLDRYEAALSRIRDGMADDRAYRDAARAALEYRATGGTAL